LPWSILHEVGKSVEALTPELLVVLEPAHRFAERPRVEPAADGSTRFLARDQPRIGQDANVLQDCGQRQVERRRQVTRSDWTACRGELCDDGTPRRIGECGERR
jgi:hypothetical protein